MLTLGYKCRDLYYSQSICDCPWNWPVTAQSPTQYSARQPQAVFCGLARVYTSPTARANSMLNARTSHLSLRSYINNQPISSRAASQWLPLSLAVQAASAHARVQKAGATQLTQLSYLAHAPCVNKLFHKQDVFGHHAVLIFGGIETWLGSIK